MIPDLPIDIIMEIMKYRKQSMYLDKLEKDQRKHKHNLLEEIAFQVEDMEMCISNMYDNSEEYDEEELIAIENTGYSLLLLENINNYNYYETLLSTCVEY